MVLIEGAQYVSAKEAAARVGLAYRTFMRKLDANQIPGAFRVGAGGAWRIPILTVPASVVLRDAAPAPASPRRGKGRRR